MDFLSGNASFHILLQCLISYKNLELSLYLILVLSDTLINCFLSLLCRAFAGPTLGGYIVDICGFVDTATGMALLNFLVMVIMLLFSMWEFRFGKGYVGNLHYLPKHTLSGFVKFDL